MNVFIIEAAGIKARAERKNVKYIRISVKPPDGRVEVSVPRRASIAAVRAFVEQKQDWIKEKQSRFRTGAEQTLPTADKLLLWGEEYPMETIAGCQRDEVTLTQGKAVLCLRSADDSGRVEVIDRFLRLQLADRIPSLAGKWQKIMGMQAEEWRTRRMKTRWGSCNTTKKRIWLNVRLAMLPPECLEYVVVHELCHLLEPSHNARFKALMDGFYPDWREVKERMGQMSAVLYIE